LQLAQAYTALANNGTMIEPTLIQEIRDAERRTIWHHTPRELRSVMSPSTTRIVRGMLESVVDSGTATAAGLSSYAVSGKSGTARRAIGAQGYVPGHYNSSFIALFPADAPQLVVVARMIDASVPNNYGGATAGTVVRGVLSGTLGLPDVLDRRTLREVSRPAPPALARSGDSSVTQVAGGALAEPATSDSTTAVRPARALPAPPVTGTYVLQWPRPTKAASAPPARAVVEVPDVRGLSLRDAARALHAAGLRVVVSTGAVERTAPAAGTLVRPGSLVRLGGTP
jgi:membrane peptidoglycan carboxypeptidase